MIPNPVLCNPSSSLCPALFMTPDLHGDHDSQKRTYRPQSLQRAQMPDSDTAASSTDPRPGWAACARVFWKAVLGPVFGSNRECRMRHYARRADPVRSPRSCCRAPHPPNTVVFVHKRARGWSHTTLGVFARLQRVCYVGQNQQASMAGAAR